MWFYGWEHLTLGHHAANFDFLRHCVGRDKTFLIRHVI